MNVNSRNMSETVAQLFTSSLEELRTKEISRSECGSPQKARVFLRLLLMAAQFSPSSVTLLLLRG